jgi:hypothetical protein
MNRSSLASRIGMMLILITLAVVYVGLINLRPTLTGSHRWDGIIGVMLGLYLCARAAAHLLDLIYDRARGRAAPLGSLSLVWPLLTVLSIVIGVILIDLAAIRFVKPPL